MPLIRTGGEAAVKAARFACVTLFRRDLKKHQMTPLSLSPSQRAAAANGSNRTGDTETLSKPGCSLHRFPHTPKQPRLLG